MKHVFSADDVPVVNGRIYHLDLLPEELAQSVMVVGDPDRVPLLADEFLHEREVDRCHRGYRTITGVTRETGMRVSLVTTGIGAPSTEIVLNELAILNEIDFRTMTRKESFAPLTIIRVGTSGGLNPATPVGALVLTDYVIGLDNTGALLQCPSSRPRLCTPGGAGEGGPRQGRGTEGVVLQRDRSLCCPGRQVTVGGPR